MSNELVPYANFNKAIEYIQREWELDWKEARKLLRTAGTAILNEAAVREAIEMAKAYNLPLRAIAIIPTKQGVQPYVTADGFRWAFRLDPRGAKSIKTEIIRFPWESPDQRIAVAKAIAEFADGSVYTAYGAASADKRSHSDFTDEDLILLAETKAVRRCLVNAIAFPFRPVEDLLEEESRQADNNEVIDQPVVEVKIDQPKNMLQVLILARKKLNLTDEQIFAALGTNDPISTFGNQFQEAWEILNKYAEERNAERKTEEEA